MAQVVKLKRSSTAGKVPETGDMVAGEMAMNTADGKLFLKDNSDVRPIVTVDNQITGSINLIGNITSSGNISASGNILTNNVSALGTFWTTKTGSEDDPALLIGQLSGYSIGNKSGFYLEELGPGFYVPWFTSDGTQKLGFGNVITAGVDFNMATNKIYFDNDVANTYIASDADDPENLEIHADANIELRADNIVEIYSSVSASGDITGSDVYIDDWGSVSASLAAASGGGGGGNVSNTGTPANDQIAVWTDSTTIEGTTKLTFENSTITVHSSNADSTGIEIYGGVYPSVKSWISPVGASNIMNFGNSTSGFIFDFLNNKIAFDGDSTNTYIQANTDTPEDLEIHADQDIILAADNAVVIGAVTDVEERISSYRVLLQSNCYLSQTDLRYLPFNSLSEQSNFNYLSLTPAAANGRLVSITVWPQSGGGSSTMGLHVNSNATAASTDTQTLSAGAPTTFTFSSGNTFSQNDELSFSINPTSNPNGFSAQIILEYDY